MHSFLFDNRLIGYFPFYFVIFSWMHVQYIT